MHDAIVTLDREMRVIELNDAPLSICGLGREAKGKSLGELSGHCSGGCRSLAHESAASREPAMLPRMECRRGYRLKVVQIGCPPGPAARGPAAAGPAFHRTSSTTGSARA